MMKLSNFRSAFILLIFSNTSAFMHRILTRPSKGLLNVFGFPNRISSKFTSLRATTDAITQAVDSSNAEIDFTIDLPTNENSQNLLSIRHSTAHVMAMAVQKLFPEAKVTIGPWIDNGYKNIYHLMVKLSFYVFTFLGSITIFSLVKSRFLI